MNPEYPVNGETRKGDRQRGKQSTKAVIESLGVLLLVGCKRIKSAFIRDTVLTKLFGYFQQSGGSSGIIIASLGLPLLLWTG